MDHSHSQNHDHMSGHDHGIDHGSHLASVVLNSTVANVSSAVVAGLQGATDIVSNIAKNLTDTGGMDHSGHMNHAADSMPIMDGATTMGVHAHSGGMKMYFHFGYTETILFYGWNICTLGGLIGSMLGIFCIAVIYEALKYFREFLFKKSLHSMQLYRSTSSKGQNIPTDANGVHPLQFMDQVLLPSALTMFSSGHALQTVLHMLQFVISYCLMLIFMTYNIWLCLACTFGAGFGYFLFGWKKSIVVDVTEHCH